MVNKSKSEKQSRLELHDRIVNTAITVFRKDGIKSITMDDIASLVGISKRTLYEIFDDKEKLLHDCIVEHRKSNRFYMEKVANSSSNVMEILIKGYQKSIENFHKTNKRFFEDLKRYPRLYELFKNDEDKNCEDVQAFYKLGVEQGYFRDDVNSKIIYALAHANIDFILNSDICKSFSFLEVYESIIFTFIRGVTTEKGRALFEQFIEEYRKDEDNYK